ncbi:MAG: hypothetical protein CHACPFDD_00370 [Phycisphaerae bacterium]|nr:hypothetical protein [Phycisphaerae bacterium]
MVIDIHFHYTLSALPATAAQRFSFESATTHAATSPELQWDSYISPREQRRLSFWLMRRLLGLPPRIPAGRALDAAADAIYRRHFADGGLIEKTVLLAFDAYHDDEGRTLPPSPRRGELGGDIYTSNSLIRALCRSAGGRLLFGASVHPYRPDAPALIDEVFAGGACLLKWIPLHQNIDIADPRTISVLRRCAQLGLPLLLHYGEEFTLTTQHREHRDVSALLDVLRALHHQGCMPPTIVAHAATPVGPWGQRHDFENLLAAMRGDLAAAPLFADISALTTPGKVGFLRKLRDMQDLHGHLLFGSDFPVPPAMWRLRRDLGGEYGKIAGRHSWPERCLLAYRSMGFNDIVFHRAAELLPNVRFFDTPPDGKSP